MPSHNRRGLTLVELLVVIAIVGMLAALLLAAVQQARESARAAQCRNNLRQFGIALASYHGAHQVLPPGCVGSAADPVNIQGWGWGTFLLPFVEEQSLYDRLEPNKNSLPSVLASASLQPYLRTPISVFRCASDIGDRLQSGERTLSGFELGGIPLAASGATAGIASGSILPLACITLPGFPVGSAGGSPGGSTGGSPGGSPAPGGAASGGSVPSIAPWSGVGVRAATSNYVASFGDLWRPSDSAWKPGDFAGNGAFGSNVSVRLRDVSDGTSHTIAIGERSWLSYASIWAGTDGWNRCEREGLAMVLATAYYPLNSAAEPYYLSCDPKGAAAYSSLHSGGANFLMLDGAVRFLADTIDFANATETAALGVFQKLARRNDGQQLE